MAEDAFDGRNGCSMRVVPRIMKIIRPGIQETVFRDVFIPRRYERGLARTASCRAGALLGTGSRQKTYDVIVRPPRAAEREKIWKSKTVTEI